MHAHSQQVHAHGLLQEAKLIGDEFLALEKFVNLNYLVCLIRRIEHPQL